MKRFFILSVGICLAFALLPATVLSAPKTVVLKMSIYQPAMHSWTKYWLKTMPSIEQVTNGRVKVKIFDSSTLLRATAMDQGINDGIADIGFSCPLSITGTIPFAGISALAGIWRDNKGFDEAHDNGLTELYQQAYEKAGLKNLKIIAMQNVGPWYIATTKKEIHVPADLKGMKIDSSVGGIGTMCINAIGANAMYIPVSEDYEALERGIVDGTGAYNSNYVDWRHMEPCKYLVDLALGFGPMALVINTNSLEKKVPKDLQEPLLVTLRLMQVGLRSLAAYNNGYYHEIIMPKHMKYYKPTSEETKLWLEAARPAVDEWLSKTGELGQKAMEIVKKYNAR